MRRRALASLAAAPLLAACSGRYIDPPPPPPRAGRVVELEGLQPSDARLPARRVSVWLPPRYERDTQRRCRVLYMHDGQNLFDPAHAEGGVPWGVDEALAAMIGLGDAPPIIVVGVWSSPLRWHELAPEVPLRALPPDVRAAADAEQPVPGAEPLGEAYLRFLVEEVKPQVDQRFRTLPGRGDTFVMGAGMGGLASLYALCRRPDVFGGAAGLSTHWPLTRIVGVHDNPGSPPMIALAAALLGWFDAQLPRAGAHRLYFDHGSLGLDRLYGPYQARMDAIVVAKGYVRDRDWRTLAVAGAEHDTAAWQARFPGAVRFLTRA